MLSPFVCFNTSHVTLYLTNHLRLNSQKTFQYISCYSLSKNAKADTDTKLRFNTSHVTLYHIISQNNKGNFLGFNTSHVTLYPSFFQSFPC